MRSNIWILLRICHLWWVLRKIRERWVKYKANGVLIEWLILMKVSCERRERRLILYVASNSFKSHWVRTFLWLKRPLHQIIIINAQSPSFPNSPFFLYAQFMSLIFSQHYYVLSHYYFWFISIMFSHFA